MHLYAHSDAQEPYAPAISLANHCVSIHAALNDLRLLADGGLIR